MAKFKLATDKMLVVGGVCVSLKSGVNETTNKELIEALRGAKGVSEVQKVVKKTSNSTAAK